MEKGDGRFRCGWRVLKTKPNCLMERKTQIPPQPPTSLFVSHKVEVWTFCLHDPWDLFPTQPPWGRTSKRVAVTAWFEGWGKSSSVRSEKKARWA